MSTLRKMNLFPLGIGSGDRGREGGSWGDGVGPCVRMTAEDDNFPREGGNVCP